MKTASKVLHIVAGAFGAYNFISLLVMPFIGVCYVLMGLISLVMPLATNGTLPTEQIIICVVYFTLGVLLFVLAIIRIIIVALYTLFAFLGLKNSKAINVLNIVMGVLVFSSSVLLGILSILAGVFGIIAAKKEKAMALEEAPVEEEKKVVLEK